jgi:hypothetical protein
MSVRRVKSIDELTQNVPPARDLWPAIAAAIEADRAAIAPRANASRRFLPAYGMAAAVVLITLGVFIGRAFAPVTVMPVAAAGSEDPGFLPTALQRDAHYRQQREVLLLEVQHRLNAMPAGEREKVASSLATLRRSISEIEAALGRDPANAMLQELLVNSCQEEMRALTVVRDSGSQET